MVLRWMAGNVSMEKDAADNWKLTKKSIERIDGIVALIMALDCASTSSRPRKAFTKPAACCTSNFGAL